MQGGMDAKSSEILHKTFSRLETIISVTVAGYITQYLQSSSAAPSSSPIPIILLACVIFSLSVVLSIKVWPQSTILTSIRSIMGVIATTSIMQIISTLGGAQSDTSSSSSSPSSLLLLKSSSNSHAASTALQKYNMPVLLLGTVFVVAAGAIPAKLKNTPEGSAIYVGIQYAYSDILIMNFPDVQVKQTLAMSFLVLFPYYSSLFLSSTWPSFASKAIATDSLEGPVEAWREAIEFAGTSFIIDSIIPSVSANVPGGKVEEEILQGLALVSIIHAAIFVSASSSDRDEKGLVGTTLESIGSFTTWRIGRRFSNILDARMHLTLIQLVSIASILMAFVRGIEPYVGKSFPKVANDLLVMIVVFKLAASTMFVFQQGDAKDAIILLFSGMVAVRLIIKLFV